VQFVRVVAGILPKEIDPTLNVDVDLLMPEFRLRVQGPGACHSGSGSILSFRNAKNTIRIKSQPWLNREIWVSPNVRAR